jgi:hypothetical protein
MVLGMLRSASPERGFSLVSGAMSFSLVSGAMSFSLVSRIMSFSLVSGIMSFSLVRRVMLCTSTNCQVDIGVQIHPMTCDNALHCNMSRLSCFTYVRGYFLFGNVGHLQLSSPNFLLLCISVLYLVGFRCCILAGLCDWLRDPSRLEPLSKSTSLPNYPSTNPSWTRICRRSPSTLLALGKLRS